MLESPKTKIVGRLTMPATPEEALRRAHVLEKELDLLNPFPRPRGFLRKFKTYTDYEAWRKAQPNPRFW
jgi:hypothetical protein